MCGWGGGGGGRGGEGQDKITMHDCMANCFSPLFTSPLPIEDMCESCLVVRILNASPIYAFALGSVSESDV